MALSYFETKEDKPDEAAFTDVLGKTASLYDDVREYIKDQFGHLAEDWLFETKASGWTLRVMIKKQAVFRLVPFEGFFAAAFLLNDKAVEATEKARLSAGAIKAVREGTQYKMGRAFRFDIKKKADANSLKKLIKIKMES